MRKISFKKIFNFISLIFIISCITYYSYRFVTLYLENNKKEDVKTLADIIKSNNTNNKNFKNVKGDYYFYGSKVNNYIKYSNLLWRIISIDKKGNIQIALDYNITALNKENKDFKTTNVYEWLNKGKDEGGILESKLNDTSLYLTNTSSCIDKIKDMKKVTCNKKLKDTLISIPSLNDYIITGESKSFLNNGEYYYIINNSSNELAVNTEGKIEAVEEDSIMGIKPLVTIKRTVQLISGEGTKDSPYIIDESKSLIGGYVKIDDDVWRIYDEDENYVRLSLDSYLKVNGKEVENKYSQKSYEFNTKEYGSLANYLNNRYLNSLKYKDILEEFDLSNGVYVNDYKENAKSKVKVRVGILSIGDILLKNDNTEFFLSSTKDASSNLIYVFDKEYTINPKVSTNMLKIVPTIQIKKSFIPSYGNKENAVEVNYG